MKNLTQTQFQELYIIYTTRKEEMKKDLVEVAKTAKAISVYLGCDFKQGIAILHDMQLAEEKSLNLFLSA
jgi:hypothetical protein